jgi:CO/xanthine dehydrogenase Mo-binding subunit
MAPYREVEMTDDGASEWPKQVGEGNSMSTPVCIANAVADALGVAEISLPLMPERVLELLRRRQ